MINRLATRSAFSIVSFTFFLLAGCAGSAATAGRFPEVNRIERELRRGVSTKLDVQGMLGIPRRYGSSILPGDLKPREVWFYDDIVITGTQPEGGGFVRAKMREQVLIVFFDENSFDGFMWFSTEALATVQ